MPLVRLPVLAALAAAALAPAAACAQDRQPTIPPPSIVEYRPRSTLVVPEHEVPRARFPVVDFHGHPGNLTSREAIERVVNAMDELNVQVMVQAMPSSFLLDADGNVIEEHFGFLMADSDDYEAAIMKALSH